MVHILTLTAENLEHYAGRLLIARRGAALYIYRNGRGEWNLRRNGALELADVSAAECAAALNRWEILAPAETTSEKE